MSAGGARTHLAGKHAGMPDDERGAITEEICRLPKIIQDEKELDGFVFPDPATKAIPELAEPRTDGLGCKLCWYVSRQRQKIGEHARVMHQWSNKRKRGQHDGVREDDVPWVSGVRCQRFFRTRVNSRWFEVDGRADRAGGWIDRIPAGSDDGGAESHTSSEDEGVWYKTRPIASGGRVRRRPRFSGFDSSTEEEEDGDAPFASAREVREESVDGSQTVEDTSQTMDDVSPPPELGPRTAPRPIPYQPDAARGPMRHAVVKLVGYLEY